MTNVLWVVVWVVLAIGLFWVSKFYMAFSLGGAFAYENQSWWLKVGAKVYSPLRLNGDVLILSWVVILRFEAAGHQDKHKSNFFKRITPEGIALIICRDSVSGTDFSRLKTWLRACLRRSA